ncbi:ketopantoate reductase family protein [Adlercreutzia sp. ZJ242]|uniref:ketopantoate reductase family protein n=1 Tax=Adlercreutzia sp. ZJ242 TaxID=2709409 RepID=UPI0013EA154A|nr:ketopantoate reductase family protein [Adlercreutzia sp. ZJ242]
MRVSIIGAGCVGSVIATRLCSVEGAEVTLLALGERADRLRSRGLVVNGRRYDIPLLPPGADEPDLVVVCVKNYQLERACSELRGWIGPETVILPLLNSISPVPAIREHLPGQRVLYGYISRIDASRDGERFEYHIAGDIHFGHAANAGEDPFVGEVARLLSEAGFAVSVDADMVRSVWRKWMLNVGANQISALTEADYVQFGRIPDIEKVLRMAMGELLALAQREGVGLRESDVDELVEYLTTYPYPKKTSMLQDVLARRKTEVEAISGEVLRLSEKWGQPCPVNETMYCLIKAKEQAYLYGES